MLFSTADDGIHGTELWKSNGTNAGTVMVKDINRDTGPGSKAYSLTAVSGKVFFTANDGVHGRELWKSNGTRASAVLVKDINGGPDHGSSPSG